MKNAAIIATDFGGNPCDWKLARKISDNYNLKLINDNCHAIGSLYENYASKYADFVVLIIMLLKILPLVKVVNFTNHKRIQPN